MDDLMDGWMDAVDDADWPSLAQPHLPELHRLAAHSNDPDEATDALLGSFGKLFCPSASCLATPVDHWCARAEAALLLHHRLMHNCLMYHRLLHYVLPVIRSPAAPPFAAPDYPMPATVFGPGPRWSPFGGKLATAVCVLCMMSS